MNGATSADVLYVNVLMFLYHAVILLQLEVAVLVSSGCSNEFLDVL